MKHFFTYLLFLSLFAGGSRAQNAKEDFARINKAYAETSRLSMRIVYTVYSNHTSLNAIDRQEGTYKKENANYSNSLMGAETIVNNSKMLTINREHKTMRLSPAKPYNSGAMAGVDLETILKSYKKIEFLNWGKKEKGYVIHFRDGQSALSRCELHFSTETYLVTRMVLYYSTDMEFSEDGTGRAEKPRVELDFTEISTNPRFSKEEFDLGKYIVFGKKNTLNPAYQDYYFTESKI